MSQEINVVTSADDKFAVGLAGTIQSALSCLSSQSSLRLFVLDGGISDANKAALARRWNDARLTVEWVAVNRAAVCEYVISDHMSDATYYRLLAPKLLPPDVSKFIFLDADLLVRRDLTALWQESMEGLPCAAVQDIGAPFVDSAIALPQMDYAGGAVVNERPIPNYQALRLSPTNPYFNGGVLIVDLDAWRQEGLATRMLKILDRHREHVLYWDQYALNVVLSGRWKLLSPLWNQNAIVFRYPGWLDSRFCSREHPGYATDPFIVHFNWLKPWQEECTHPFADEYLRHLEGSPWQVSFGQRRPIAEPWLRKKKLRRIKAFSRGLVKSVARRAVAAARFGAY